MSDLLERNQVFTHLNNIISTQANLAGAEFNVVDFMNLVVEQMLRLTPATGVVVELKEDEFMVYKAATGTIKEHLGLRLPIKNSISGLCIETGQILHSNDTEVDPRVNLQACRIVGARSLVVTPLLHDGSAIGVLKIISNIPNAFTKQDVQTLKIMAGLIGSALAKQMYHEKLQRVLDEKTQALEDLKIAEEKLKHMANYDFLTDLPNRALFLSKLQDTITRTKRTRLLSAVLFLDIDHFKQINDTLGHAKGDELLKAFAMRIKQCIRASDVAGRLGGDEFVILLNEIPDKETATNIAEELINKIKNPFNLQNTEIKITTSIGLTYFDDHKKMPDELLKEADEAMYKAKKGGKNQYKIYEN